MDLTETPTNESLARDLAVALQNNLNDPEDVQRFEQTSPAPAAFAGAPPEPSAPVVPAPLTDEHAQHAPAPVAPMVPSQVPAEFRNEFTQLSPAAAAWLKNSVEIKATLTQKTQEFSAYKQRIEAEVEEIKADAITMRRIRKDKDLLANIQKYVADRESNGGNPPAAQVPVDPDDGIDPLALSPTEYQAYLKRRDDKLATRVREETLKLIHDQYVAPQQRTNSIRQTIIDEFIVNRGLDKLLVERAAVKAEAHARKFKLEVTPENVTDLVNDFLEASTNEPAPVVPAPMEHSEPRSVATPPMGGGMSPSPMPSYERAGKRPETTDDYHAAVIKGVSRKLGTAVTKQDLRSMLFGE